MQNGTSKYGMGLFFVLVTLMISSLGFQWQIYDSLRELDKKVAVIETKLTDRVGYGVVK